MHHSDPHSNSDQPSDQQAADHMAEVLAKKLTGSHSADTSPDDIDTAKLGAAIRDSAKQALPPASDSLRAAVLERLDAKQSMPDMMALDPASKAWRWQFAAIAATAAGLLIALSVFERSGRPRAVIAGGAVASGGNAGPTPAPVIRYRTETRTRFIPVQKTRTETRTREVPVTTMTTQTKTVMVDGKEVPQTYTVQVPVQTTRTESYQVSVPYTESVAQNYTVQVPVSEGEAQPYTVSVPYTEPSAKASQGKSPVDKFQSMKSKGFALEAKNAWATQINRAWLEGLPAPKLPAPKLPGDLPGKEDKQPQVFFEQLSGERYESLAENQFVNVQRDPFSTFSIDVDTASYANTRRFLNDGQLPPPNAVRIEEFLNYFQYDYPQPKADKPFSVNMEVAACPWNSQNKLLRIGIKGKEILRDKRPASNLVFLLDVSGSMRANDKLPLMKQGLNMMVKQLREDDFVSIVTYAGDAGVLLPPTSGDQVDVITSAIDSMQVGGSTNGSAGIDRAYEMAVENFVKDGTNRVILATDGDLNVGITDDSALTQLIQSKAGEGVFLTVLGFGTGNLKDAKMEKLADNGNGNYAYIDSLREAHKVLVNQMSGNLVTIAKDVKLQLDFNPKHVGAYRLIGYENRALETKDFSDDKKDAGEIGAGHTVTALYELIPAEALKKQNAPQKKPVSRYRDATADEDTKAAKQLKLSDKGESDELLFLQLRHKKPDADSSELSDFVCKNANGKFEDASEDFRFAASVASFGMLLRGSKHTGDATFESVQKMASDAIGDDADGNRSELVDLIRKSAQLQQ